MAIENKSLFLENVDRLRQKKLLSKTEFNRLIYGAYSDNRPKNTLWRSDQQTISRDVAEKVASLLNTSVDELLTDQRQKKLYTPIEEKMLPQDDARNAAGGPSYAVTPDHLGGFAPTRIYDQVEIRVDPRHKTVMDKVVAILESGETDTIEALQMNVDQFEWKIKEKREIRELRAIIGSMKKRQDDLEMLLEHEKKGPPGLREPVDPVENE